MIGLPARCRRPRLIRPSENKPNCYVRFVRKSTSMTLTAMFDEASHGDVGATHGW